MNTPHTPENIDRYKILHELGRGGMATVYQAYDPRFEREVAIKVLPSEFLHDPQFRTRFEREAKAIASLEHPAIVPVYDFGDEQGQPFIVMRLMSGGTLSDRLRSGPLPLPTVIEIISRLAPALDAAHARGIIHRDLKPGNILFDRYDNAFLSDFGIARNPSAGATLTIEGVIGTPAYISPEQVQGNRAIDGRSDTYALGVLAYQMLTGQVPYPADTAGRMMMAHVLEPIPDVNNLRSGLPAGIPAVLQKVLAKDPDERYSKASEFAAELKTASMAEMPTQLARPDEVVNAPTRIHSRPAVGSAQSATAPGVNSRQRWIIIGGGLLLVILVAGIVGGALLTGMLKGRAGGNSAGAPAGISAGSPTTLAALVVPSTATSTFTPEPTATPSPTETATLAPSPTLEPPTPTLEPSPVPTETAVLPPPLPILGGADKIAFINGSDVWVMNVDGTGLQQLTNDRAAKTNLQFTPDGQAVNYISGKCIRSVELETGRINEVFCLQAIEFLDAFEISPDGSQVAISIDRELYVVPYDLSRLVEVRLRTDIRAMGTCESLNPYQRNAVKQVRWSNDGRQLAVKVIGVADGQQADLIDILDISQCLGAPPRVDQFPATRFTIDGYQSNPEIQNFDWDGEFLFSLTSSERNAGFGRIYIYNSDLYRADLGLAPVDGVCCYRDPVWSPDGSQLLFAFQDIRQGPESRTQLYLIPAGTLGTGVTYQPIPLPGEFFADPREKPMPVMRPAAP